MLFLRSWPSLPATLAEINVTLIAASMITSAMASILIPDIRM